MRILVLVLVLVLSSCTPESSEKVLESRVLKRWEAMIASDYGKAYGFFSPAYRRLFSLSDFSSRLGVSVKWLDAEVVKVSLGDERADILVNIEYELDLPGKGVEFSKEIGRINDELKEVWLFRENTWWYANSMKGGL